MLHILIAGALALAAPQQTDTTFAVRSGGRLEVDNYGGSVTVRTWGRNEIRVQATHAQRTEVEIDQTGSTVSIDASAWNGNPEVVYVINVPRSFRVSIDGINTDASVEDLDGDVMIETVEGDITVRNVTGRVAVESVSGFVRVEGVRGRVSASSTNESIRLSGIVGEIDVKAVNGSISMLDIQSSNVSAETVNGAIALRSTIRDGGNYALSTTNGEIVIAIPDGTNASFETSTFSGRVESTMSLTLDRRKSGEQSFRIGNGSAHVALESFAGTVRLVKPAELKDVTMSGQKNKNKNRDK
ncbi:MAG: DUF4097 family beta strand repeat-containing protein [Longimicrobiales bacterium]